MKNLVYKDCRYLQVKLGQANILFLDTCLSGRDMGDSYILLIQLSNGLNKTPGWTGFTASFATLVGIDVWTHALSPKGT